MIAIPSLKIELQEFQEAFNASDHLQNSVEHNCQLLKDTIHKAISKHIPSKLARSRNKLPWINLQIKQKMKLRKHLYDRAKWTGNYTNWCDYKQARNEVNILLETAHRIYCSNLFSDSSTSKKDFGHILRQKERITLELHHSRMEKMFIPMRSIRLVFWIINSSLYLQLRIYWMYHS